MTDRANIHLCVLHEAELRAASKLLKQLHEADQVEMTDEAYSTILKQALQAAMVALWDLGDLPLVILTRGEIKRAVRKKPTASARGET